MISKFIEHFFAKKINKNSIRFTYTFHLGAVIISLFCMLIISGILLMLYYVPESSKAYDSILFIEEKVFVGKYIRSFHRMCNHLLLIFSALHLLRIIFSGIYKHRASNYHIGLFAFILFIFWGYTGYLLPFDQLSYWATVTGMELIKILPFAGDFIVKILSPDGVGHNLTLTRFYTIHVVILPLILTFLVSVHMYSLRKEGLFLSANKILRDKIYKYSYFIILSAFISVLFLSILIGSPLETPADFFAPPNPVKSAWFLLWIQEIVSWNAAFFNFIPLLFIFYWFLPKISKRQSEYKYFAPDDKIIWGSTLILVLFIITLTTIGYYFRGENWQLKF